MKKFIPYFIFYVFLFYLIPYLITIVPIIGGGISKMVTLIFAVLLLAISGIKFGSKHKFSLFLPLIAVILFIPSAFLHNYRVSRIIFYSVIYFISILIGTLTGLMFKKK